MKHLLPVAALAAAVGVSVTAACGTTGGEPTAPPSSTASATGSAVQEYRQARAREVERQLELNAEAGLPGEVDRGLALAAAQDREPFAFALGTGGCSWLRTPDGALWSLHSTGGALLRDTDTERFFRQNPGAAIARRCVTEGTPTRPDLTVRTPYRWIDGTTTKVSIDRRAYALPAQISPRGEVLTAEYSAGPTSPTN